MNSNFDLYCLVKLYREAIKQAYENNEFIKWPFCQFPDGCCGAASDILARFLREYGIYTKVVSGGDSNTTHVWLVVDDVVLQKNLERDKETANLEKIERMKQIIEAYGYSNSDSGIHPYHDFEFVLDGCTIIDITGSQSQFRLDARYLNYNIPVYIGEMDDFHKLFDINSINDFWINDNLDEIYRIVQRYL